MRRYGMLKFVTVALTVLVSIMSCGNRGEAAPSSKWTAAERQRGYVVFRRNSAEPIDCRNLMPRPFVVPNRKVIVQNKVSCELAPGEAESVVIGIHGLAEGVKNVRLEAECDLEVRVYRGVDSKVRKMFLEYRPQDGDSSAINPWIHGAFLDESNTIASVGKGVNDIFWLTILAKPDTAPGLHRGKIRITSDYVGPAEKTVTQLDLEVQVRPFVLQRARIAYAPFFYIKWGGGPIHAALPTFAQTDEWIGRLYRDMAEHAHTSVTFYGQSINFKQIPPPKNRFLSVLIPLGKKVGLLSPEIPGVSWISLTTAPESSGGMSIEQKNRAADWYEAQRRISGSPELISYCFDEPSYPTSRYAGKIREALEPFRKVRVRAGTAINARGVYGFGELIDVWLVYAGQITPEMQAEAKRLGAEVWTYSCHLHSHQTLAGRYYAGLYMWAYGVKGHTTWHHHAQGHFKYIWLRENSNRPMPTVGWETRRDGIDDYRYLQMLEDSIAANPGNPVAAEAEDWLESLRERLMGIDPHLVEPGKPLAVEEYDQIKSRAADYIEQLGPVIEGRKTKPGLGVAAQQVRGLKDEGKLFRGKSVEECMRGLEDDDYRLRRAAAWALFEKGPAAAPATRLLAEQLKFDEVRMPALRALEVIGPKAYPAVPEMSKLLSHDDFFVRLGAVFALGGIVGPWQDSAGLVERRSDLPGLEELSSSQLKTIAKALAGALMDESHVPALAAADALVRMGPAAKPALPQATRLLGRPYNLYTWKTPAKVTRMIAAIGPQAAAAVPKLVEIVEKEEGQAGEIMALAAIGPSAMRAIPVLEKYASDEKNSQRGVAYYALACIRGESEDMNNLVNFLKKDKGSWAELARYLDALGVKASPVAGQAREMLKSQGLDEKIKAQLESFLKKVEKGEGSTTFLTP